MTPEEERELERFEAQLKGMRDESSPAFRLGEKLRRRRAQALAARDETAEMRVWRAIDAKVATGSARVPRSAWSGLRLAQAAALVFMGIGAGWLLHDANVAQDPAARLEFSYGDFERIRGSLNEQWVRVEQPVETVRSLGEALIADGIPFELYSLGASADRRVVFTLPANAPRSRAVLADLGVTAQPDDAVALTFSRRQPAD